MQLPVKDVARLLNVSEKTIYRWIKQKVIPFYCLNEQFRFNRAEILEWATSRRIQVSHEIFAEPEATGKLPSLSEAIRAGGVAYRVSGKDKSALLRSVVEVMRLPDEVDRDHLYQVLLARELLGSTAIGEGIAIPHVRNPIVLHVNKPIITLCFLDTPIDFGALDGQPVSVLFALVSPTIRAHLHLLSRLSFLLQNSKFKELLLQQVSRDELMEQLVLLENALPATFSQTAQTEPDTNPQP